jgi:hypothetical protein
MPTLRAALLLVLCASACAAPDAPAEPEDDLAPAPATVTSGGKADGPELRVRAGQMTMWIDRIAVATRDASGQPVAVIEGRTSRNLAGVFSWVPDDAFGTARQRTLRTFEIELRGGHEVNTLLSGLPIFVAFDTTTGAITHYEGMIALAPRFASFEGSSDLFIDAAIDPVWGGTPDDPLRYRGHLSTSAPADQVTADATEDAAPVVTQESDLTWQLDWSYAPLERAAIPATDPVHFTAERAGTIASKSASVEFHAVQIGLTTADPRDVFPGPTCTDDVRTCVREAGPNGDLGDCGLYREVQACLFEDPCADPPALELQPIDASSTDGAADAFRADCNSGGDWCSLSGLRAFTLPACTSATLEDLFELVRQLDQDHSSLEFSSGQLLDRAGAAATPFFAATYSDGGPGLLEAVEALGGADSASPVEVWSISQQVPCHNCTDFADTLLLFYPATSTVVLLDGGHGFDS